MRTIITLVGLLVAMTATAQPTPAQTAVPAPRQLTPILHVETIEPSLPFWIDRLGFTATAEVMEGDKLGFVILVREGIEVMYQTRASIQADVPALAAVPTGGAILFIKVADLDPVIKALAGVEILVPRRQTSYGADEIFVREPGGNIVGFAAFTDGS